MACSLVIRQIKTLEVVLRVEAVLWPGHGTGSRVCIDVTEGTCSLLKSAQASHLRLCPRSVGMSLRASVKMMNVSLLKYILHVNC